MSRRRRSLRGRIVATFLTYACAVSLGFVAMGFVVAWVVEDAWLEQQIAEEIAHQQDHWGRHGRFAPPVFAHVSLHRSPAEFPADLARQVAAQRDPQGEYAGDEGRHYHVLRFALPDGGGQAWAVAEVSNRLVVRPLTGELLVLIAGSATLMLLAAGVLGYGLARRATAPLTALARTVEEASVDRIPRLDDAASEDAETAAVIGKVAELLEGTRGFVEREHRFTRDASHELRTPITVIRSSAELMATRGPLPCELSRPLQRIEQAARDMERTVDLLLLLAREEAAPSVAEAADLLPLVERVVLAESERIGAHHVAVSLTIPANRKAKASTPVAEAIIRNLVANALVHGGGAPVAIRADADRLEIADQGAGMSDEWLEDLGAGRAPQGRGIGLSIVLRLCRLQNLPLAFAKRPEGGTLVEVGL